jgi:hypothetical protein
MLFTAMLHNIGPIRLKKWARKALFASRKNLRHGSRPRFAIIKANHLALGLEPTNQSESNGYGATESSPLRFKTKLRSGYSGIGGKIKGRGLPRGPSMFIKIGILSNPRHPSYTSFYSTVIQTTVNLIGGSRYLTSAEAVVL